MKNLELTPPIELFLNLDDPIVLQVFAIYNHNSKIAPLFLTRDECNHLSMLYNEQLLKVLEKNKNQMQASTGSIEHLYFKQEAFIRDDETLKNVDLPSVNYLLIELKKEDQRVKLLKKVTDKQLIEGRKHSLNATASPIIKQRNVLDLTPKIHAISIGDYTFIT
ncbi:hypothetical protein ACPDHJ_12715 [Myroides sp. C8-3]|uniref:hypothetical protein n=1 Tax=unclassified Myroides TaxID=2642485 RepID=UPI0015F7E155|nr:hypothetical protein [Myroides sp. NP-2]MBB1149706.1 hypothetical protein [Myroides sp. NP-2]